MSERTHQLLRTAPLVVLVTALYLGIATSRRHATYVAGCRFLLRPERAADI
ncbi:hypothetical protein [Streptomyces cyaneofuscatus]|uniref:hypothetical protein n=1 Tax=Streptomyces cyaneofuscatus TaxID=66883 RepID=UPI00341B619A